MGHFQICQVRESNSLSRIFSPVHSHDWISWLNFISTQLDLNQRGHLFANGFADRDLRPSSIHERITFLVRVEALEAPRLAARDPKSRLSTCSSIPGLLSRRDLNAKCQIQNLMCYQLRHSSIGHKRAPGFEPGKSPPWQGGVLPITPCSRKI